MSDTSITKIDSRFSPRNEEGAVQLASGIHVSLRLWREEPPADAKPTSARDYETVGYVIAGKAELHLAGQTVVLEAGNSWSVPRGTEHTYRILETFTALAATSPPAQVRGRDLPP